MEQWVLTTIQTLSMGIEHWKGTAQVLEVRAQELQTANEKLEQETKVALKDLVDTIAEYEKLKTKLAKKK